MRAGRYITQLPGQNQYKAFIPNPLPFEIHMKPFLQNLLSKADLALGRLDGIAEEIPDVNFFIFMYIRKEATLSSQIEGTLATFADVLKVEAKIKDLEIHKDVDEIFNYDVVLIGSPNHFGGPTRGVKKFIDKFSKSSLKEKSFAVFDTYIRGDFEKAVKKMEKRINEKTLLY